MGEYGITRKGEGRLRLSDPNEGAGGEEIKKGDEVWIGEMDATVGFWATDGGLIARAMDIDISGVAVYVAATVETRFKTLQP